MLDAWRPGRAFPGLRRWWKHFKMTDLQWALNFLHYWLCQRRFQRQLPWCELISSCWLPRGHTQRWCIKPSFAASALPLCFLQPSAVAAVGSSSQALTTSKKKHTLWGRSHCTHDIITAYPHKREQNQKLLHLLQGWNSPFHHLQTHPGHPVLHHTW